MFTKILLSVICWLKRKEGGFMATIRDITEKTGVSPGAVSRILNNDPYMSVTEETRQKVIHAARELGYKKKNKTASGKSSFTLGIVQWFTPQQEIEDSYYLYIRHGIEDFCIRNNITVIRAFKSDYSYTDALRDADALICIGKFGATDIKKLKKLSKILLFIDMELEDDTVSTINLDYSNALFQALDYLTEHGHREIGFLGGREYLENHELYRDKRKDYFEKYCTEHHINYKEYTLLDRFSTKSGYDMMLHLIRKKKMPTAIFAASDPIAIGALSALTDRGFHVPEDISIIGFDDTDASAYTNPPLTTIHTPSYHMGFYGAGITYHLLSATPGTTMKIKLPCSLTIRGSVKSLK